MQLFALHGFLGNSLDWDFLQGHLPKDVTLRSLSLYDKLYAPSELGLWAWGRSFNKSVKPLESNVLLGYSLGGRLALHALLLKPSLFKGAIIISANPHALSPLQKIERQRLDALWAERFASMPWQAAVALWNAQALFGGGVVERFEIDANNMQLAKSLIYWSIANQDNLILRIQALKVPILWITGSKDTKYTALAQSLKFTHPLSRLEAIEGAFHRVHVDYPEKVALLIADFLKAL